MKTLKSGDVFNNWTVIDRSEKSKYGYTKWDCVCKCGNKKDIADTQLKKSKIPKCDLCKNTDKITLGIKIGSLKTIKIIKESRTNTLWEVECDCGVIRTIWASGLKQAKFCGQNCIILKKLKYGDRFNFLTFIGYSDKKNKKFGRLYQFKCDCGSDVYESCFRVKNGVVKHCGCESNKIRKGYTCGYLTAIAKDTEEAKKTGKNTWKFKCVCGTTITLDAKYARQKNNINCGCVDQSDPIKQLSTIFFTRCKYNAKERGLEFTITVQDILNILEKQNYKCKLSGLDVYMCKTNKELKSGKQTASIDRIDSSKGYAIDNIQITHKLINKMKWDLNQDEFFNLCELVTKNKNST